jgi:hypothetical protein
MLQIKYPYIIENYQQIIYNKTEELLNGDEIYYLKNPNLGPRWI